MSKKAEEAALKAYPEKWFRDIDGDCYDSNKRERIAYKEGYEQAEKDLALTWEDMKKLDHILNVCDSENRGREENGEELLYHNDEEFYGEALRRFNEQKNK